MALARGDAAAATASCRQAFEDEGATDAQRKQALDSLLAAAVDAGTAADHLALGGLCVALGLSSEARAELSQATRGDSSLEALASQFQKLTLAR